MLSRAGCSQVSDWGGWRRTQPPPGQAGRQAGSRQPAGPCSPACLTSNTKPQIVPPKNVADDEKRDVRCSVSVSRSFTHAVTETRALVEGGEGGRAEE